MDSSGQTLIRVSARTKRLDAAFAQGDNEGGRDVGDIADGTWHVFAIVGDGAGDVLFSTSATTPTPPPGFTRSRRIGCIVRSGGAILGFTQNGDDFRLKQPVEVINVAATGATAAT